MFGGGRERPNILVTLLLVLVAPWRRRDPDGDPRSREYAADRLGAEICGLPLWLASALDKIAGGVAHLPNEAAEGAPRDGPPLHRQSALGRPMDGLFSTHPATENRIAALVELAQSSGLAARGGPAHGVERGAPRRRGRRPDASPPAASPRRWWRTLVKARMALT